MRRRTFLGIIVASVLTGCGIIGGSGTVTVADIVKWLQDNCGFATSVETVVKVIATVVSGFTGNGSALVVAGIATQVEQAICNAVQQKMATEANFKSLAKGATKDITVVVNGIDVSGTVTGK